MILGMLLWFSASFGLQDSFEINEGRYLYHHPPIFTEIEIHAGNEWLDIYGVYRNEMEYYRDFMFLPLNDYFTVGAELTLVDGLSFNYEHMCQHPVASLSQSLEGEYGGYNKIWIEINSK